MNRMQIKKCRENEIRRLADRYDGDFDNAALLYKRLVRFTLRWYRWATVQASEKLTGYRLKQHVHEGELLGNMHDRLTCDLKPYGLHLDYPGLYPSLYDEHGNHGCDLFWY